jgi:hypothetical protein
VHEALRDVALPHGAAHERNVHDDLLYLLELRGRERELLLAADVAVGRKVMALHQVKQLKKMALLQ